MDEKTKRLDTDERTALILQTAETLFEAHGVEQVSMHQIAQSAGVGQGTVYRRYANKGDLCMALMHRQFHKLQQHTAMILAQPVSFRQQLKDIVKAHIHFLESHVAFIETIHDTAMCAEKKQLFYESQPYQFLHGVLCTLLNKSVAAKQARPIQTDFTAHMMIASINPKVYLYLRKKKQYSEREIVDSFAQSFIDPLYYK
ncbi:TetR/AcrR family transcriptional regulator [Sporolactobacillus shoreicorticis]|uniref:TetR/AcrR family transcriptional regulator n=1 Tax=Sporolactobacillus shoreicorticis TaxID=1923877 RepID=A0ABW5S1Q2_9BACL|nr:TetR/AcrR family transcriptional regulator [Sporolactobacillus shoreicorticis]MCO7127250.1 TetR/AcrR family transcriptional regulator [Sporolactobacillus shoreicorticis]